MKAIGAILFAGIFLLTTMQQTIYLCLYKLNEKAIIEKYCVNKNVKGSCCRGKCYLNKAIARAENDTGNNPFSTLHIKLKEAEILCQHLLLLEVSAPQVLLSHTGLFSFQLPEGSFRALIKPPIVLG